jgi:hypothetical protein
LVLVGAIAGCLDAVPAASPPPPVLISDYATGAIVRCAEGALEHVATADRPAGLRIDDGVLYAAGFGRGEISRFDLAAAAAPMGVFYRDTALLEEPVQLRFAAAELLVLGNDTGNIVALSADGTMQRTFGYPLMRDAHDFIVHGEELFVAGARLTVWDLARGELVRTLGERSATGLVEHDGALLVSDAARGAVVIVDPNSGAELGDFATGLDQPLGMERGPDGAIHVLDATALHRFDRTGAPLPPVVEVATSRGLLVRPRAFTFE